MQRRLVNNGRMSRVRAVALVTFLLLTTHLLLMTTPQHLVVMGHDLQPQVVGAALHCDDALPLLAVTPLAVECCQPLSTPGDCPVVQAVLQFSLLVVLSLPLHWSGGAFVAAASRWVSILCYALPPPLAPARRRALLQVFLH